MASRTSSLHCSHYLSSLIYQRSKYLLSRILLSVWMYLGRVGAAFPLEAFFVAKWSNVTCDSSLSSTNPMFRESNTGHVRRLPVTWALAVVICCEHPHLHVQPVCHDVAEKWTINEIQKLKIHLRYAISVQQS